MLMGLLRLLPPEAAHALTLQALKLGLGPTFKNNSDLRCTLFGKEIRNPIGLSGGADKEAAALPAWSKMGFGMVEAGTVTLHPRVGNPKPRMWRMKSPARAVAPSNAGRVAPPIFKMEGADASHQYDGAERMAEEYNSVINWLGLPGRGLEPFIKNLAAFQKHPARKDVCVGASIASPDNVLDEFKILAKAVTPYVDYITLNASCPNVAHEDHEVKDGDRRPQENSGSLCERSPAAFEQIDNAAAQIKAAKQGAGRIPVLVKLGPTRDKASLERMVRACIHAGADGFVATNTVPFSSSNLIDARHITWPTHNQKEVGGYSGPQLLEISTWMVREIRKHVPQNMPVIGVGGIQSGEDAKKMLECGATAIQLYTGLIYKGPDLLNEIAQSLQR